MLLNSITFVLACTVLLNFSYGITNENASVKSTDCVDILIENIEKLLSNQQYESKNTSFNLFSYLLDFDGELKRIFDTCIESEISDASLYEKLFRSKKDIFYMRWMKSLNLNSAFTSLIRNSKVIESHQYETLLTHFIKSFRNLLEILRVHYKTLETPSLMSKSSSTVNPDFKAYYSGLFNGLNINDTSSLETPCTGATLLKPVDTSSLFDLTAKNSTKVLDLFAQVLPKNEKCYDVKFVLTNWLINRVEKFSTVKGMTLSEQIYEKIDIYEETLRLHSNLYIADFDNKLYFSSGQHLGEIFSTIFSLRD